MEKNLRISLLLDYYGELLNDKQRRLVDAYYNGDLSLSEIAENEGITRQGVRDGIKRAEVFLQECEEKLGLIRRSEDNARWVERLTAAARSIPAEDADTKQAVEKILEAAGKLSI